MDKNFIKFEIEEISEVENIKDSQFATAKLKVFSSGFNLNKLYCSEDTLRKTAQTIENCPILYNFEKSMWGKYDFGTHTDPSKALICGFIVPGSISFEESEDGNLGLIVIGKIWKKYAEKVLDVFSRNSNKKVSVEMEMSDSCRMKDYPDTTEMLDFEYFGVCLLGDRVAEGSPGANMEMISFAAENEEYKKVYTQEFSNKDEFNSRYKGMDFSIPEGVKLSAQKALDLSKKQSGVLNAVYMSIARHLVNSKNISIDKLKLINKKISSKMNSDENTNDRLAFIAMGGGDAVEWSKSLVDEIDELDKKKISYFEKVEKNKETEVNKLMEDKNMKDESFEEKEESFEEKKDEAVFEEDSKVEDKEMAVADSKGEEEKETPEDEKAESPEKEADEEEKKTEEKMALSLDAYMDVAAVMGFLANQTAENKVIADKYSAGELEDKDVVCAMFDTMCKMAKDLEECKMENMSLKEFKEKKESEAFTLQVESFMQDFQNVLPTEEITNAKEDSFNFSLDNLDAWKNKVQAKAYTFAVKKKDKKDSLTSVSLPFDVNPKVSGNNSPWKR